MLFATQKWGKWLLLRNWKYRCCTSSAQASLPHKRFTGLGEELLCLALGSHMASLQLRRRGPFLGRRPSGWTSGNSERSATPLRSCLSLLLGAILSAKISGSCQPKCSWWPGLPRCPGRPVFLTLGGPSLHLLLSMNFVPPASIGDNAGNTDDEFSQWIATTIPEAFMWTKRGQRSEVTVGMPFSQENLLWGQNPRFVTLALN